MYREIKILIVIINRLSVKCWDKNINRYVYSWRGKSGEVPCT